MLSNKRPIDTLNGLKQRIMILEQDKVLARENAAGWKEKYFVLEK